MFEGPLPLVLTFVGHGPDCAQQDALADLRLPPGGPVGEAGGNVGPDRDPGEPACQQGQNQHGRGRQQAAAHAGRCLGSGGFARPHQAKSEQKQGAKTTQECQPENIAFDDDRADPLDKSPMAQGIHGRGHKGRNQRRSQRADTAGAGRTQSPGSPRAENQQHADRNPEKPPAHETLGLQARIEQHRRQEACAGGDERQDQRPGTVRAGIARVVRIRHRRYRQHRRDSKDESAHPE